MRKASWLPPVQRMEAKTEPFDKSSPMIRSILITACLLLVPAVATAAEMPIGNLHWREVGPAIAGGRVTSVAGSCFASALASLSAL